MQYGMFLFLILHVRRGYDGCWSALGRTRSAGPLLGHRRHTNSKKNRANYPFETILSSFLVLLVSFCHICLFSRILVDFVLLHRRIFERVGGDFFWPKGWGGLLISDLRPSMRVTHNRHLNRI
jgi:hypothetical protein